MRWLAASLVSSALTFTLAWIVLANKVKTDAPFERPFLAVIVLGTGATLGCGFAGISVRSREKFRALAIACLVLNLLPFLGAACLCFYVLSRSLA